MVGGKVLNMACCGGPVAGKVPGKMMGLREQGMPVHSMGGAHGELASRAEVRAQLCDLHAMLVVASAW